uniref:ER membrane protein complex subunit 2 n=1 Tax=Trichuris muris TaxID=70415 RepID=A0A5S6Q9Z3_TRIMR
MEPVMVDKLSLYNAVLLLEKWREEGVRQPETVLEIWDAVVKRHVDSLDEEKWLIYEQVYIAALDCANMAVASYCFSALERKFKKGQRLLRLQAMSLEANGMLLEAIHIYDTLIKVDPTNPLNYKRKVTSLVALGKVQEAIKELCDHLSKFMNDHEAWVELCQLYLRVFDFSRAAFCLEEMILSKPLTYAFHMLYAEVKCTQGGMENLEVAKLYYCQALKLKPNCARASWGLYMCCVQAIPKVSGHKRKEFITLLRSVTDSLFELYSSQVDWDDKKRERQLRPIRAMLKGTKIVES